MKLLKRAAALCMAAAMAMSLSVTAFAVDPTPRGTLNVYGNKELIGKNVMAIRMFSATYVDNNENNQIDSGDTIAYTLEKDWENLFSNGASAGKIDVSSNEGDTLAEKAYDYVSQLTATSGGEQSTDGLVGFAKQAAKYALTNKLDNKTTDAPALAYVKEAEAHSTAGAIAVFGDMTIGYYLVIPDSGSTSVNRQTDAMLVNVPSAKSVNLHMKSEYPTVEKTASSASDGTYDENTSAQIGDTVYFKLTSKVPDTTDYESYVFKFVDTMSPGLTFDADSVVVKVGGVSLEKGSAYTVTPTSDTAGATITIDLSNSIKSQTAGANIEVTYTATLNENAVVVEEGNGNSVKVVYSNNPSNPSGGLGESNPDETDTFTYKIDVHKYTGDWNGGSVGYLSGATFILSKDNQLKNNQDEITDGNYGDNYANVTNAIKLVAVSGGYRVAKEDDVSTDVAFTTTSSAIAISGLEAGVYYLHEVAAPDGYNKLNAPIRIEIKVVDDNPGDENTIDYEHPTFIIGTDTDNDSISSSTSTVIPVLNKSGITLPETGSIGTIGLTVAGVAIVLVGMFAPRKKKENQE